MKSKTGEVNEKLSSAEGKLNQKLNEAQAKVEAKVKDATGIDLGGGEGKSPIPGVKIPDLKGLFKKK